MRGPDGLRPVLGANEVFQTDPHWRDYVPFYEYFHGDTGAGVGASHQTGWTALVAKLLEQTDGRDEPRVSPAVDDSLDRPTSDVGRDGDRSPLVEPIRASVDD
jgi:hypothetical protein